MSSSSSLSLSSSSSSSTSTAEGGYAIGGTAGAAAPPSLGPLGRSVSSSSAPLQPPPPQFPFRARDRSNGRGRGGGGGGGGGRHRPHFHQQTSSSSSQQLLPCGSDDPAGVLPLTPSNGAGAPLRNRSHSRGGGGGGGGGVGGRWRPPAAGGVGGASDAVGGGAAGGAAPGGPKRGSGGGGGGRGGAGRRRGEAGGRAADAGKGKSAATLDGHSPSGRPVLSSGGVASASSTTASTGMASRQQCRSASVSPTREPESGKENATSKLPPPDVLEENIAAQRDEIFALQSIYEEDFTVQPIMHCPKSDKDPPVNECMPQPSSGLAETTTDDLLIGFVGSLLLRVVLPSDPMALVLPPQLMNAEPDVGQGAPNDGTAPTATVATTPITHLPPVTLRFHLPPTYPSSSIPHLALQCSWLPAQHLDALRRRVAAICKEEGTGSVVLFLIADFVVNDAIGWLGLVSTSSDEVKPSGDFVLDLSAPLSVQASSLLPRTSKAASKSSPTTAPTLATITAILDHDKARIDHLFAQSSITCGICLDSKRGSNCKRFTYNPKDPNSRGCGHAYCNDCLVSYFTLHITEGSISLVTCPNETCKKQTHPPTLPDDDLCALVGDALMSRYTELRTKAQLESQPDMIHCPRALCQHPTKKPAPPEKLCICDACAYPFCFYCLRTWHGNQVSCPIDSITALAARYATARAADDAAELAYLDARYGRAVLDRILRAEEERRLNADWLKAHSQRCPDCACAVERSEGCAHMTCRVCKTHFCFLCGVRLRPDNPYAHYSDRTAPCFGRLFDGADVDAEPPDHVWFDEEEEDGG